MATRLIDFFFRFFFRFFFGSPDQEYRGVPSVEDDKRLEKTMAAVAMIAVLSAFVLEFFK